MIPIFNLTRQYKSIEQEINSAIKAVFEKGSFILGTYLEKFEQEFSSYCGTKYAIGVGSGTEALHLALLAAGVSSGDEVITVSNTAVFTVSAISFAGAKPIFVDIDPDTFTIDTDKIEKVITEKTRAIIPVHLYGQCAEMEKILNIAEQYNLKVIEDACQAHGSEYNGKKAGSIGDLGCFSFYPSKNLGAYGDAGMITTDSDELNNILRLLRNGGQEKRYYHVIKGYNSRLDEIQAAVLSVKLKYLEKFTEKRIKLAEFYSKELKNDKIIKPIIASNRRHVFHLYVIRSTFRDKIQKILAENEVQTFIHYPIPVHKQIAYSENKDKNLPVTEKYSDEILSLPMFPELEEKEVVRICEILNSF